MTVVKVPFNQVLFAARASFVFHWRQPARDTEDVIKRAHTDDALSQASTGTTTAGCCAGTCAGTCAVCGVKGTGAEACAGAVWCVMGAGTAAAGAG